MKMKMIVVIITTVLTLQLQAQNKKTTSSESNGVYIQLQGGFGLSTQTKPNLSETNIITGAGGSSTETFKKKGLGTGINVGLLVGKTMSDNIALEFGASYFMGSKQKVNVATSNNGNNDKATYSASIINLAPALVIKTSNSEGANLYAKIGPVIGLGGKTISVIEEKDGSNTGLLETTDKKGIALGIQSALGLDYILSDRLSFIAELNFRDQQFAPKEGEITKYTLNGTDILGVVPIRDKKFEYVDKVSSADNTNINAPSKRLKQYNSLSSLALNIGLRFNF
jgi:hypothetical protein